MSELSAQLSFRLHRESLFNVFVPIQLLGCLRGFPWWLIQVGAGKAGETEKKKEKEREGGIPEAVELALSKLMFHWNGGSGVEWGKESIASAEFSFLYWKWAKQILFVIILETCHNL